MIRTKTVAAVLFIVSLLNMQSANAGEHYTNVSNCLEGYSVHLLAGQTYEHPSNFYNLNNEINVSFTASEEGDYAFYFYNMHTKMTMGSWIDHFICTEPLRYDLVKQARFALGSTEYNSVEAGAYKDSYLFFPEDPIHILVEMDFEWYAFRLFPLEDCNGDGKIELDEDCAKLVYVSGSGQTGDICKTLKSPFVVAVEGGKLGQETVGWAITNTPSGKWAEPKFSGDLVSEGESGVTYKKYFNNGSQGNYEVTATCEKCSEGSPQKFTATATCPTVPTYRQTDYPNDPYDNWCKLVNDSGKYLKVKGLCGTLTEAPGRNEVAWSIADKGCALTSLTMVMGRYGNTANPVEWDNLLPYIGGYTSQADVDWKPIASKLSGITAYDKPTTSLSDMDSFLEKCKPVIARVKNGTSEHWVVVTGKSGDTYNIIDPGYSSRTTLATAPYNNNIYKIVVYSKEGECK